MFEIEVTKKFQAAHALYDYKGQDEAEHIEQWTVKVRAEANELDQAGCVLDFHEVDEVLNKILQPVIDKSFNQLEVFKTISPSAENIAKFLFGELAKHFDSSRVKISKVFAFESDTHSASYFE